jgi:hypothetical protein
MQNQGIWLKPLPAIIFWGFGPVVKRSESFPIVPNGAEWCRTVPSGAVRFPAVPYRSVRFHFVPCGTAWTASQCDPLPSTYRRESRDRVYSRLRQKAATPWQARFGLTAATQDALPDRTAGSRRERRWQAVCVSSFLSVPGLKCKTLELRRAKADNPRFKKGSMSYGDKAK